MMPERLSFVLSTSFVLAFKQHFYIFLLSVWLNGGLGRNKKVLELSVSGNYKEVCNCVMLVYVQCLSASSLPYVGPREKKSLKT